jgi:tryptophan synthase alpha chain
MSRIQARFDELGRKAGKAFIPYITAGDPNLETTYKILLELEASGADIVELGVPFSDPMADGPVIQRASERALRNGVTVLDCLDLVRELRRSSEVPVVLFSYLNPLLSMGRDRIGPCLKEAGVDGLLGTDLVPEEAEELREPLINAGIDTIFLAAPTSTDERLRLIAGASTGFVYVVSRTGVTGMRQTFSEAVANVTARLRRFTKLPLAVGFGISEPEQVREVWRHADGAVVGSRIVAEIEKWKESPDVVSRVGALARLLKTGAG